MCLAAADVDDEVYGGGSYTVFEAFFLYSHCSFARTQIAAQHLFVRRIDNVSSSHGLCFLLEDGDAEHISSLEDLRATVSFFSRLMRRCLPSQLGGNG
ncbi:hypothetical protein ElyMa_005682800 [Elysia marginata]|uniref:Uncharacterized protein n=1 Tax=Elysia marginata TaxID=1093978 RepID=A0AAV4FE70_9GAST|nr:hypothetical protein ElyMa_005682800 [Elysia marginata]